MASPRSVKRRRLNDNRNTLTKPFVSPLKTAQSQRTLLKQNKHVSYQPSTLAHTIASPALTGEDSTEPKSNLHHGFFPTNQATPSRRTQLRTMTGTSRKADPAEIALQKEITKLEMRIRNVKNDVNTLKQAASLRTSTTDADLEDLSLKWKLATQAVAEELFGSVKERVNRMGGVAAWREAEKRKYERSNGLGEFAQDEIESKDDDADCEFDSEGEELPEAEQEWRKAKKRKARQEAMDAAEPIDKNDVEEGGKTSVWMEGGDEDDAFTIDVMLRSLNIELSLIGFDKESQRWVI